MLKKIPVKNEYLLALLSVILLVAAYQLALKKTLDAWQMYRQLKTRGELAAGVAYQPAYTDRKISNLNKIINTYQADTTALRNNNINEIALLAERNNVKLAGVPTDETIFHSAQYQVQKLQLQGDYFSLVKTLNDIRSTKGIGVIRSVNLYSQKRNSIDNKSHMVLVDIYLLIINKSAI